VEADDGDCIKHASVGQESGRSSAGLARELIPLRLRLTEAHIEAFEFERCSAKTPVYTAYELCALFIKKERAIATLVSRAGFCFNDRNEKPAC